MAKGYQCPSCGENTGKYEKGAYHCKSDDCGAVWWGAFDKPSAGRSRKGFWCLHCGNYTTHPIAEVAEATIWRCSTCATTIIGRE